MGNERFEKKRGTACKYIVDPMDKGHCNERFEKVTCSRGAREREEPITTARPPKPTITAALVANVTACSRRAPRARHSVQVLVDAMDQDHCFPISQLEDRPLPSLLPLRCLAEKCATCKMQCN
uniref:ShKT domain-containing protein n=1 Tax=Globodera pallida TaxID=36090 RepID=A0A183CI80_GLOPA